MIDEDVCGVYGCRKCGGETLFRPVVPGSRWADETTELECIACGTRIGKVHRAEIIEGRKPAIEHMHLIEYYEGDEKKSRPVLSLKARTTAWNKLCALQGRHDEVRATTLPTRDDHQAMLRDVERYSQRRPG